MSRGDNGLSLQPALDVVKMSLETHTHTHAHARTHARTHTHTHAHTHTHTHAHTHTYTRTHMHTHTHTHTRTGWWWCCTGSAKSTIQNISSSNELYMKEYHTHTHTHTHMNRLVVAMHRNTCSSNVLYMTEQVTVTLNVCHLFCISVIFCLFFRSRTGAEICSENIVLLRELQAVPNSTITLIILRRKCLSCIQCHLQIAM